MAQIKLTDAEALELKAFYQLELDKLNQRASEIKAIMNQLSGKDTSTKKTATVGATEKKATKKGRKQRKSGPWPEFILKTLGNGDGMTLKELLPVVQAHFKGDAQKTENNLRGHLVRMTKRNELKGKKIKGSREIIYSA